MGLMQGGNLLYLNVSCGFLRNKNKNIESRAYTGFFLSLDLDMENKFGDKLQPRVILKMKDDKTEEVAAIQFTLKSWYTQTFFAKIGAIDLTKPFTVGTSGGEDESKVSFCWMYQGGKKIVKDDKAPRPVKNTVGDETVNDWTSVIEHVENTLININAMDLKTPQPATTAPAQSESKEPPIEDNSTVLTPDDYSEDDLPF